MLREISKVRQVSGEPKRRWFFCNELDLVLWEGEDGSILGFQLAYDKHRGEHSFSWHRERGYTHYVVDDGEPMAGVNQTPLLYANGPLKRDYLLHLFHRLAADIPPRIAGFVEDKLRQFDGPLDD